MIKWIVNLLTKKKKKVNDKPNHSNPIGKSCFFFLKTQEGLFKQYSTLTLLHYT